MVIRFQAARALIARNSIIATKRSFAMGRHLMIVSDTVSIASGHTLGMRG